MSDALIFCVGGLHPPPSQVMEDLDLCRHLGRNGFVLTSWNHTFSRNCAFYTIIPGTGV